MRGLGRSTIALVIHTFSAQVAVLWPVVVDVQAGNNLRFDGSYYELNVLELLPCHFKFLLPFSHNFDSDGSKWWILSFARNTRNALEAVMQPGQSATLAQVSAVLAE